MKCQSENSSYLSMKRLSELTYPMHTVTFDNDKGFANHMDVASSLNMKTYFTRPYTSQEKGTVENRIRQKRRTFPKKIYISMVTSD
jgi:IS30 family transposase